VQALLLTHAHAGHYLGLGHLGKEGLNVRGLPVHCTARMAAFLGANRPFSDLVDGGSIRPVVVAPSEPVRLAPGLVAVPEPVPHRDDGSDTVAWVLETSRARALYMPDIDVLDARVEALVASADLALVDGTFFDAGELGNDGRVVPHPPVRGSLGRLARAAAGGTRIVLTHINHTNPLCDPGSPEAREVERAGMAVARDGMALDL
jgi:pyrroloquinoline quinone biosynthesis protein B